MTDAQPSDILLDVTRLVWRVWRGRLPTGIDRVCFSYLEAFGPRSLAVIQRRGLRLLFTPRQSQRLFAILREGGSEARRRLVDLFVRHGALALLRTPPRGGLYLNVGHTGLNDDSLPQWIADHRLKAVYLVHDLIPISHPATCRPGERERHMERMRNVLVSAAGIIGNSQATLNELGAFAQRESLPTPESLAAWIAGKPRQQPASGPAPGRPYFVTLGTIEPRKNHQLLLDVWERLVADGSERTPKLMIIGARGWEATEVFRRLDDLGPLANHVEELNSCGDEQLTDLIAGARALLMPSVAEGYGLPVFEALELGTPVIATDLPVYREVVGDLPTYLRSDDSPGWEAALRAFCSDGPERRHQIEQLSGFRAPSWAEHFAKVNPWLKKLPTPGTAIAPFQDSTMGRLRNNHQKFRTG